MINGCLADGLPEPEFEIQPSMFSITFRIRNNDGEVNGSVNVGLNGGLNEVHMKIVDLMVKSPQITATQIANLLKTTKRRIEYHIDVLKKAGKIERIGSKKNGHWVVKKWENGIL